MTKQPLLKLGTRRSPLALAQAEEARARLCAAHGWDSNAVELVPVEASGDKIQDRPLAEIGGKALWTKELDIWLGNGEIDASVHSLKDVETIRPDAFTLIAILPRADKRDRLIGAASLADLPKGAVIGTSAPRRAAQALHQRPDCKVVTFRGNVATRLAKLEAGEADATFLAAAGLLRLGQKNVGVALEPEDWLPAPAQGAIAVECRADDVRTRELLSVLNHAPSHAEVMAERALLLALGGNCHSPIAVRCDFADGELSMRAALFSPAGQERVEGEARFAAGDPDAPARLAADLLQRASSGITSVFSGS
ncbi:hydroxymethylbilane synthase [Aurantiacibacter rhizosphaerae]|uniref:Porphobilinogen deaminase n=1 Tax=Aurantiacibacter rhizosphaerae TaxID=2691582 RepID=A0A844XFR2_9SPHN|nr:hydroxymethylbilane synthase [Aurantiacibacter rhizosphaerae]MWV28579.1 hydroxymethylbilane synthase [Aurantiacibacter rhizosphaerae]